MNGPQKVDFRKKYFIIDRLKERNEGRESRRKEGRQE